MPWIVREDSRCPDYKPWAVVNETDESVVACHATKDEATQQQKALYANEPQRAGGTDVTDGERAEWTPEYVNDLPDSAFACIDAGGSKDDEGKTVPRSLRHYPHHDATGKVDPAHLANARARVSQEGTTSCGHDHLFTDHKMDADMMEGRSEEDDFPMRDNLVRAMESTEFRAVTDEDDGRLGTLYGRMATYNQWAEVDSKVEGHFMERILPGAFTKTIQEQRSRLKVIFDHGMHPTIGRLPLGSLEDFVDGPEFIDYRASLFDTSYNRDLLPGLRSGVYGSSYRFDFAKARVTRNPPKSEYNPLGLPERSVNEIRMRELGPTPFPVYDGTSATVRSLTDVYYQKLLTDGPALEDGPDPVQSEPESRATVDFPVPTLDEFVRMLEE